MPYEFSEFFQEYYDSVMLPYTLLSNSVSSLLGIAMYVLTALGLYTIAKRRGINNPWLAWIPVVNCWIVGCISDQYRYVVKGQTKSKRKTLLILNIIQFVLLIVMCVVIVVSVIQAVGGAIEGINEYQLLEDLLPAFMSILVLCLPLFALSIATMVVRYMAMYDLYTSCDPQNNVAFLVVSIIFNVTEPFFVFFNRKKDEGMPPRRDVPQVEIPAQPAYEPSQEPQREFWETSEE